MLEKVVSGGQTGVDQAGLRVAKELGIVTGGWLPKGCLTETGPCPELLEMYSMKEHYSAYYQSRTEYNVRDSDGTIRIARNFDTYGEKCTLRNIKAYRKPYMDIKIGKQQGKPYIPLPGVYAKEIVKWLESRGIKTLNIAGNRESTCPGIGELAYRFLLQVFPLAVSFDKMNS